MGNHFEIEEALQIFSMPSSVFKAKDIKLVNQSEFLNIIAVVK